MPVIEIEQLSKSYRVYQKQEGCGRRSAGCFAAVSRGAGRARCQLDRRAGRIRRVPRPQRAGKTTTLKLLSGVIYPTSGTARVLGYVPWERENAYRRRFALVMGQKNQLWWDLPAMESFRLHQQIYRIEPAAVPADARRADRAAGHRQAAQAAGPRAVARRADEDGADRGPAAFAGGAVSRRADDRPGRGRPAQHPAVPAALSAAAARSRSCSPATT